jgi:hypothetical protein
MDMFQMLRVSMEDEYDVLCIIKLTNHLCIPYQQHTARVYHLKVSHRITSITVCLSSRYSVRAEDSEEARFYSLA